MVLDTLHRQIKYLDNVLEADHGKPKQLTKPMRDFKTLKTAYATIKGSIELKTASSTPARSTRNHRSTAPPQGSRAVPAIHRARCGWPR